MNILKYIFKRVEFDFKASSEKQNVHDKLVNYFQTILRTL